MKNGPKTFLFLALRLRNTDRGTEHGLLRSDHTPSEAEIVEAFGWRDLPEFIEVHRIDEDSIKTLPPLESSD